MSYAKKMRIENILKTYLEIGLWAKILQNPWLFQGLDLYMKLLKKQYEFKLKKFPPWHSYNEKALQIIEFVGPVLLLSPFVLGFQRCGRDMNQPFNCQSFNILAKSENPIPRIIPKWIFVEFQSFASFQWAMRQRYNVFGKYAKMVYEKIASELIMFIFSIFIIYNKEINLTDILQYKK